MTTTRAAPRVAGTARISPMRTRSGLERIAVSSLKRRKTSTAPAVPPVALLFLLVVRVEKRTAKMDLNLPHPRLLYIPQQQQRLGRVHAVVGSSRVVSPRVAFVRKVQFHNNNKNISSRISNDNPKRICVFFGVSSIGFAFCALTSVIWSSLEKMVMPQIHSSSRPCVDILTL